MLIFKIFAQRCQVCQGLFGHFSTIYQSFWGQRTGLFCNSVRFCQSSPLPTPAGGCTEDIAVSLLKRSHIKTKPKRSIKCTLIFMSRYNFQNKNSPFLDEILNDFLNDFLNDLSHLTFSRLEIFTPDPIWIFFLSRPDPILPQHCR